jgi:short-subunit dehydrogenase
MRRCRAGHILDITSMGGIITLPGLSFYHGSKFALEGISDALGKEVKDLGIHVTAIEPICCSAATPCGWSTKR